MPELRPQNIPPRTGFSWRSVHSLIGARAQVSSPLVLDSLGQDTLSIAGSCNSIPRTISPGPHPLTTIPTGKRSRPNGSRTQVSCCIQGESFIQNGSLGKTRIGNSRRCSV